MKDLYQTNSDFRKYVDGYANLYQISTDVALTHALVHEYAEYIQSQDKLSV